MSRDGRPTKYDRKFIAKADEYLKECHDKVYRFQKAMGKTDGFERRVDVNLPTIEGFAVYLGVNKTTLYEWAKKHNKHPYDFSNALYRIKDEQRKRLTNKGLSGEYNPLIAKLILSSNHGMSEKSDLTSGGKPIKANTIVFADFKKENATGGK